jgi:hypothetical protein
VPVSIYAEGNRLADGEGGLQFVQIGELGNDLFMPIVLR